MVSCSLGASLALWREAQKRWSDTSGRHGASISSVRYCLWQQAHRRWQRNPESLGAASRVLLAGAEWNRNSSNRKLSGGHRADEPKTIDLKH
jgi:hypothetical protein